MRVITNKARTWKPLIINQVPAAQTGAFQKCKIICEEAKSDCVIPAHTVVKTSFHPLHLCKCGHRLVFVCRLAECSKIGLYVWYKGPCVFSYTLLPLDVHRGIYRGNVSRHRYSEKLKKKSLWKILDGRDLKGGRGSDGDKLHTSGDTEQRTEGQTQRCTEEWNSRAQTCIL